MSETFIGRKRVRKSFGKIREVAEMPNLIEVQKSSYDYFLQATEPDGGRDNTGLQSVFTSVFPIADFNESSLLTFINIIFWCIKIVFYEFKARTFVKVCNWEYRCEIGRAHV